MNVLLTGGDGLLGSNLVRELIKRKVKLKVLVYSNKKECGSDALEELEVSKVYGDILDPKDVENAISGCDTVIHAAANTSIWPSRSNIVRRVNFEGTKNLVEAAIAHKIKRFIHIGSGSSYGFGSKASPGTEKSTYRGDIYSLDYIQSKYEAQQYVLKAAKERNLPAIVVSPTFMLGPCDSKPGSGKMIIAIYNKKLPMLTSGGRNFVYVKDVAVAICNALTMGKIGESYIAGGQNLTYKEIADKIATTLHVNAPKIIIPNLFIKLFGFISSMISPIFKVEPLMSYPMSIIACDNQYYSAKKAINELQMPQTKIEEAIKQSFEWFREKGYC